MVNVPPLLCSTPPPIDFGEEDDDSGLQSTIHLDENDEYSEFGLVSGAKEPLPSPDPVTEYREKPPDDMLENKQTTVEAFNYEVKQSIDYDVYRETAPPTPPPLSLELDEEVVEENGHVDNGEHLEEDEEEETNTNESVPSLKLDSLSLYSTESVSAASTLSPLGETDANAVVPEPITKANVVLSHQVTLEDVSDDSDEECSPKKPKELFIREGAKDFFAIEVLATPTIPNGDGVHHTEDSPRNKSLEDESFKMKEPLDEQEPSFIEETITQQEKPTEASVFQFANFEAEPKITTEQKSHQAEPQEADDDDFEDFGDFADFAAAEPEVIKESLTIADAPRRDSTEATPVTFVEPPQDDGFDDFQEFSTPAKSTTPVQNHDEDDDDDFGDFSEPAVATIQVPPPPPPATVHLSLDERVKPVLEMMFPQSKETVSTSLDKRRPLAQCQRFNFGAIEHARALKYEWGSSEMRHALVRSLGIDSRNILFGDKWNSSMPRFAANLSFDPLKPLKPLSPANATATASTLEPTVASSSSTYQGLETGAGSQASQTETRPSQTHGKGIFCSSTASNGEERPKAQTEPEPESQSLPSHHHIESPAAASAATVAPTAATLSPALSADSPAHQLNGGEQLHQQQQQSEPEQFDLRATPSPTQPPLPLPAQEEIMGSSSSSIASYAVPLKETHIYTPSKSDTAVAKTTTLAPIDFDYEMAATGIIIDETVVKKEYRDVEYKPPFGLDSPSKVSSFDMPPTQAAAASTEDDDFSDFQSMPAVPRSRLDTPTFGEQMILSPAILLPQAIPLAKKATSSSSSAAAGATASIEWGDNALASINAEEMARIEELFSSQTAKPPTISASVAKKKPSPTPAPTQAQEDDEWSDFVSVPVATTPQQNSPRINNNNNINGNPRKAIATAAAAATAPPKDDDWSDFVSSTPVASAARPAPQFNSGAWQTANFYNNPLSLYQAQQQQQQHHSNLIPSHNNNKNNNNNVPAIPQQIHIMHDFSTAPVAGGLMGVGTTATYQQHHQRQQFQIGNAKVAPRISLIPDLSFVAPALPTNAGAFMGSLPKPSFGGGKK
ncbi:LOW QUALITY PROTEIN: uncharacterized protein LOC110176468 [Drosophila serrata]|uniref:LOW QUALITY PROTEIN: uncharacterized protein LOC110176468 n=1 Tax=Drosophila serrata TaxID=7274 RepID=UPI000A1D050B|nr:LOW QUALITY PROTEIN: uncharacterized protein LOC110176468 [Drosophila serrata]